MTGDRERAVRGFEDLRVFQKAYALFLEVNHLSLRLLREEQYGLAEQIRRASKSICANLAEGYGKQSESKREFKRFLRIALGSSDEMRVWIRYCLDLGYIDEKQWSDWRDRYQEVSKILQGLHSSWK